MARGSTGGTTTVRGPDKRSNHERYSHGPGLGDCNADHAGASRSTVIRLRAKRRNAVHVTARRHGCIGILLLSLAACGDNGDGVTQVDPDQPSLTGTWNAVLPTGRLALQLRERDSGIVTRQFSMTVNIGFPDSRTLPASTSFRTARLKGPQGITGSGSEVRSSAPKLKECSKRKAGRSPSPSEASTPRSR